MQDLVLATIDHALDPTPENAAKITSIETLLSKPVAPAMLQAGHPDNPIDADKKAMESLFAALEEHHVQNPKKLTEFEVYARLEHYAEASKPK